MQPLFESFSGPLLGKTLGQYDNHQKIISRRLEQMYTSSDTRLEWSGVGHYSNRAQINAIGPKGATIRVTSQAIIEVRSAALVQTGHPARRLKVHCLSICVCGKNDQRYSVVCNVKNIYLFA